MTDFFHPNLLPVKVFRPDLTITHWLTEEWGTVSADSSSPVLLFCRNWRMPGPQWRLPAQVRQHTGLLLLWVQLRLPPPHRWTHLPRWDMNIYIHLIWQVFVRASHVQHDKDPVYCRLLLMVSVQVTFYYCTVKEGLQWQNKAIWKKRWKSIQWNWINRYCKAHKSLNSLANQAVSPIMSKQWSITINWNGYIVITTLLMIALKTKVVGQLRWQRNPNPTTNLSCAGRAKGEDWGRARAGSGCDPLTGVLWVHLS